MILINYLTITLCLPPLSRTITFIHIKKLKEQRKVQQIIRWTSTEYFNNYIKDSLLHNWNINVDDINIVEAIYGTPTHILQVKIKRTNPPFVTKHPRIPLPLPIASHYTHVQVYGNLLYVKKQPSYAPNQERSNFYLYKHTSHDQQK